MFISNIRSHQKHVGSLYSNIFLVVIGKRINFISSLTSQKPLPMIRIFMCCLCVYAYRFYEQLWFALFVHRTLLVNAKKSLIYANYVIKFPFQQTFWLSFLNSNSWWIDVNCLPSFIWFDLIFFCWFLFSLAMVILMLLMRLLSTW